MPARFVGVNSTFDEQRLAINDLAIDLFALQNETAVDYARVAGVATYAEYAGFSTFTPLAGVSTYSSISGYSTTSGYAGAAGIATNATFSVQAGYAITAGVSTEAGYATAAGFADTSTYATFGYYSQIAGFATAAQDSQTANLAASIRVTAQNTGTNYLTFVNVLGDGSYQNVWTDSELKYEPATNSFYAGIISATSISGDGSGLFNVSSEVVGVSTAGTSGFNNLNVAGVSTFSGNVNIGTAATTVDLPALYLKGNSAETNFIANPSISIGGTAAGKWYDTFLVDGPTLQYVRHWANGFDVNFSVPDEKQFVVSNTDGANSITPPGVVDNQIAFKIIPESSTELRYNKVKKLETTGVGVSITGELEASKLRVGVDTSTFAGEIGIGSEGYLKYNARKSLFEGLPYPILEVHAANGVDYAYRMNCWDTSVGFTDSDWLVHDLQDDMSVNYNFGSGGNGEFIISGDTNLPATVSDHAFVVDPDGATELYYNFNKKLETAGYGVTVTGTVYADDFSTAGIATANEFRLNTYGVTSYTRIGGGQVLASGVNDKGSVQVGALTTVFSMGHAPFNHNCYFSQTGENDWVFWTSLSKISMTVNGGISTRPHSVTVNELYVDTNANVAGVTTFQGETNFDGNINSPINVVGVTTSTFAGDVGVGTDQSSGVVLTAPNGSKFRLIVDNIGNLSTVAV